MTQHEVFSLADKGKRFIERERTEQIFSEIMLKELQNSKENPTIKGSKLGKTIIANSYLQISYSKIYWPVPNRRVTFTTLRYGMKYKDCDIKLN